MDRLFHVRDIAEIYGLSMYEAKTIMERIPKINIGRGEVRPRWVAKQSDIEAYLAKKARHNDTVGLDRFGKILRRR